MNITEAQSIFMLGIAGSGMRGLAWLLAESGKKISGADRTSDATLDKRFEIATASNQATTLSKCDLLIFSDAVPVTHPLRVLADNMLIPSLPYQNALGEFASQLQTLAVTGTHGKSSTTAFLAHIMVEAKVDPTVLVGAAIKGWPGQNARLGHSQYFVVEADEYRQHFLTLQPSCVIITSIDFDHPDYFSSLQAVTKSYDAFLKRLTGQAIAVTTQPIYERYKKLSWPAHTIIVPEATARDVQAPIAGQHMQSNAALAIALAQAALGIDNKMAQQALNNFPGLARRLESLGQLQAMTIISDYAHHPTEISATLTALRGTYPGKKILAIFEAHMIERLNTFFDDFAASLKQADSVIIYPPFSPVGREDTNFHARSKQLATHLQSQGLPTTLLTDRLDLPELLRAKANDYDLAVGLSAGSLDTHLRQIVAAP